MTQHKELQWKGKPASDYISDLFYDYKLVFKKVAIEYVIALDKVS